jgi:uncharacterized protein YjlB
MTNPEARVSTEQGAFPNSLLPLLVYRRALPADAAAMERHFAARDWGNAWRDGIFPFHRFHSTAHEALGIVHGEVHVLFGGPRGAVVTVRAGDVVVIPAGVGHCNQGDSGNVVVVGAYSGGRDYDLRCGDAAELAEVRRNVADAPQPETDPVGGRAGHLLRLWR